MTAINKATVVFVHGLWADGSCWNEIIPTLQKDGFTVVSVQNPLTSLQDDVAAVDRALNRANGPVILVGHSWGGFVITHAGNHDRVKALVYVAALGPDTGESLNDLAGKFESPPLFAHLDVAEGYIWVNEAGIPAFAGDLSKDQQSLIHATQGPANASLMGAALEPAPAWKSKPSWYVLAQADGAINPDLQRFMSQRMNATTVEVNSSHVPMISQPQVVLDAIYNAAAAIS